MKTIVFPFLIIILFFDCGSSNQESVNTDKTSISEYSTAEDSIVSIYSLAIGEYLKVMREKRQVIFDTLFLGKHEEFPDIKLPAKIENTNILVLSNEEADKKFTYRKSMAYVNMVDFGDQGKSEFLFVIFYVDKEKEKVNYWPQHNCTVKLVYNKMNKKFKLENVKFDFPYPKSVIKEGI